ncbi:hypothetical protein FPQ18DRAFT_396553 [Pyronema domesticum]|uniref:Uncharacterized protein n=1 Tax=Pyronema omphalodes (strain CBS 100304) TaxID=1076935 RepID=U4LR74_PYROM|nr:hypothetical protein FPQ18DRAFT_396553 [Pyronema domesticum]CCX34079.1 Protein of unknown function [Pyronema omphalodes CBS 100304]
MNLISLYVCLAMGTSSGVVTASPLPVPGPTAAAGKDDTIKHRHFSVFPAVCGFLYYPRGAKAPKTVYPEDFSTITGYSYGDKIMDLRKNKVARSTDSIAEDNTAENFGNSAIFIASDDIENDVTVGIAEKEEYKKDTTIDTLNSLISEKGVTVDATNPANPTESINGINDMDDINSINTQAAPNQETQGKIAEKEKKSQVTEKEKAKSPAYCFFKSCGEFLGSLIGAGVTDAMGCGAVPTK